VGFVKLIIINKNIAMKHLEVIFKGIYFAAAFEKNVSLKCDNKTSLKSLENIWRRR